jgi:hypothetical protein
MQGVIGMVILILDIIAIIDLYKSKKETSQRLLWLAIILVLPFIGLLLYFLVGKKR